MGGRRGGGHEEHGDSIPSNILSRKPGGGKRCPTSDCQPEIQAAGVRLNVRFGANQYQLSAKERSQSRPTTPPPPPPARLACGPWIHFPEPGPRAGQSASATDAPPPRARASPWLGPQSSSFWVSWNSLLTAKPMWVFSPSLLLFPELQVLEEGPRG